MTDEARYLRIADSLIGLRGKEVLEVGGCVDPVIFQNYKPKTWISIDINPRRFEGKRDLFHDVTYKFHQMSVTEIEYDDASFDRIFSINCFEHVDDMKKALSEMHRVLRPGGLLFTIFGPVWSSPVGHHTYVEHEGRLLHFNNNIFPDWYHLSKTRHELHSILADDYGKAAAEKITSYIYDSNDLNRLTDGELLRVFRGSNLDIKLRLFKKRGAKPDADTVGSIKRRYPNIHDMRNTELLLVMAKKPVSFLSTLKIYSGFLKETGRAVTKKSFKKLQHWLI